MMTKKISFPFALSMMIITTIGGMGFGYYLTPEYQQTMYIKSDMGFGKSDIWVDKRYIQAMIVHHRSAIHLAEQAETYSKRSEIMNLAREIVITEPKLIEELYEWKKLWFKDSKSIADESGINLGTYDDTFDLRFLNALIAHHEEGIQMAREIRIKTTRNAVLDNADAVEQFLSTSLIQLKQWRNDWYGVK
jgi:uncharacterized protein (DUF305 family)